jgi:hypothetical protein
MQSKLIRQVIALNDTSDRLNAATNALSKFAKRKARLEHPEGSFDNASRFYPSNEENCGVMSYVRSPSRNWPNSYMLACRSLEHCEDLCGADHDDVLLIRRFLKLKEADLTDLAACQAIIEAEVRKAVAEARAERAHRLPSKPPIAARVRARA